MDLYHGSVTPGIRALQPVSALHERPGEKVVYLTGSAPYALFYIWDAQHNKMAGKYVTCRLENGVVTYEEQFDGQLRAFYEGVSGWLYRAERTKAMFPVVGREDMWASREEVPLLQTEFIPDVYAEIQRYVHQGRIIVTQMPHKLRMQLRQHQAKLIIDHNLMDTPDCGEAEFYRTYFSDSWHDALHMQNN